MGLPFSILYVYLQITIPLLRNLVQQRLNIMRGSELFENLYNASDFQVPRQLNLPQTRTILSLIRYASYLETAIK